MRPRLDVGDHVVVEARGDEVVIGGPRGVLEFQAPQAEREPLPEREVREAARADRMVEHRSTKAEGDDDTMWNCSPVELEPER